MRPVVRERLREYYICKTAPGLSRETEDMNPSSPEHGGRSVKGGGRPSSAPTPAQKDIDAGEGYSVPGYQKTPGIADPGVPGSRTNPVEEGRAPKSAKPHAFAKVRMAKNKRPKP